MSESEIQRYYEGKTILVTGGTGFLGKLLLEKLLRTCHGLAKVYLLMREKGGTACEARLARHFDDPLYDRLKRERAGSIRKVFVVAGDLRRPGLGLSDSDRETLTSEVNCVFHLAATVRFDEDLRVAARVNVGACADVIELARRTRDLQSLVHVSTAFSFCPRRVIDEVVYEPAVRAEELLEMAEGADRERADSLVRRSGWPNTYSFTKAVAEDLVKRRGAGLPLAIVRPSIVVSTAREPVAGWTDSYYGTSGLLLSALTGILRTMVYRADCVSDLVPADYVVNNVIAVGWDVRGRRQGPPPGSPSVYNYVSGVQNPITWGRCQRLSDRIVPTVPSVRNRWCYFFVGTDGGWKFAALHLVLHVVPAAVLDWAMFCVGRPSRATRTYARIGRFVRSFAFFTTNEWTFGDGNARRLWDGLGPADRRLFQFDVGRLDWEAYFEDYLVGLRVHLLKDPLDTLPRARRRALRLRIAHRLLVALTGLCVLLALLYPLWNGSVSVRNIR